MRFGQEFIDKVGKAAEFSYNLILRLFFVLIGIAITCIVLSVLLGYLGYLPHQVVVFAVTFSAMIIICILILWSVLWFRTVNAKPRYEIHNWYYDRYGSRGFLYKVYDLPLHSNKYALLKILIMLLLAFLLILYYKK